MGKFILCSGVLAKHPFHFELTKTNVYSMEELCYYLYHNIYAVNEEDFDLRLVQWLREEVKMEEIADKLESILEHRKNKGEEKNPLKDIVVSILCSTDYFTEQEIMGLIKIIDSIFHLSPMKRNKIKGDNYLKYNKYTLAALVYEEMLRREEAQNLTPEEYGEILHNQAIAHIHTNSLKEASREFKEAYSRNGREESLRAYFMALKLGKCEKELLKEMEEKFITEEQKENYENEIEEIRKKAREQQSFQSFLKLKKLKEAGKVSEYYEGIDKLLSKWKQEYRHETR